MANTFNARTSESKNKKKRNTLKIIFNERSIIFRLTRREINKSVNVSVNLRPTEYAYTLEIVTRDKSSTSVCFALPELLVDWLAFDRWSYQIYRSSKKGEGRRDLLKFSPRDKFFLNGGVWILLPPGRGAK